MMTCLQATSALTPEVVTPIISLLRQFVIFILTITVSRIPETNNIR